MQTKRVKQMRWFGYRPWVIILIALFLVLSVLFIPFFPAEQISTTIEKTTITSSREVAETSTSGDTTRVHVGWMKEGATAGLLSPASSPYIFVMPVQYTGFGGGGGNAFGGRTAVGGGTSAPGATVGGFATSGQTDGIEYRINPSDAIIDVRAEKSPDNTFNLTIVDSKGKQLTFKKITSFDLSQKVELKTAKSIISLKKVTEQLSREFTRRKVTRVQANLLQLLSGTYALPQSDTSGASSATLVRQVQKDAYEFEKLLQEINAIELTMVYPADISLGDIIPSKWMLETNKPAAEKLEGTLAIPIAKDTAIGLRPIRQTQTMVWFEPAGKFTPVTDIYIVGVGILAYLGPPQEFLYFESGPPQYRDYPKRIYLDFLKDYLLVDSPYFIPPNTTHGVYQLSWNEFRKRRSDYGISQLQADLADANPYILRNRTEARKVPKFPAVVARFQSALTSIENDLIVALAFSQELETKYFKPNSESWTTQGALTNYRKQIETMRGKLLQIRSSLQKLETWDFYNLEQ